MTGIPVQVPKFDALMMPVIEALKSLGGSGTNEEIHDRLAEQMRFPQHVIDEPFSDGTTTKLRYRINWAKSYLKAFGALSNSTRGVWALTELGARVAPGQEAEIKRTVRLAGVAKRQPKHAGEDEALDDLPELAADEPRDWRDRLLSVVLSMTPDAFERLCKRVLREAGFSSVEVTGKSGDGGIDGVGVLRVGLISFRVVFQAKRWQGSVGSKVVRELRGAMDGRTDKGIVITTSTFTSEAGKEAARDGARTIDLIDGEMLCDLLLQYSLGVRTVEAYEIEPAFFEAI